MATYACRSRAEQMREYEALRTRYEDLKLQGLKLDMSRGKPSKLQLDLVSDMLTVLTDPTECIIDGNDARNYGDLAGLKCAREYWADMLGCKPWETFVGGNASLSLMHDLISWAHTHGLKDSPRPWNKEKRIKFLCPSPGYDRHFAITETLGFELIPIEMNDDGPDMDDMTTLTGLSREEIIAIHSGTDYKIYRMGFLPGFVYLGGLDPRICAPRLSTPRTRIEPGSVGIGGSQTGVYPVASPGGWRILGYTPLKFYDPLKDEPILCRAGQYIRFVPISREEYERAVAK